MKEYEYESVHDDCKYKIKVGESAQENWDLIDASSQNDIWFHVEAHPSCHVVLIIDQKKKTPHKTVINYCGALCKEGSKLKDSKNVKIIYTNIKNVKKGDKTGSVTTKNTKELKI
jgi:predicted ribosome quality control (RQC) complex YloA/Tae2 family protein